MKKINSTIYFAVMAVTAIGLLIWIASPDNVSDDAGNVVSASNLILDETFFDFGNISMAAGIVSHEFKVKNEGDNEVVINQIYTSCMCTSAIFFNGETKFGPFGMAGHGLIPKFNGKIGVGEEAIIKVDFDPAAHGPAGVGPIERAVYLIQKNNDQPLEIRFRAVVTP